MLTLVQKVPDSRPKSKLLIPDPGRSSLHFPAFSGTLSLELACSPPVGAGEGMTGGGGACAAPSLSAYERRACTTLRLSERTSSLSGHKCSDYPPYLPHPIIVPQMPQPSPTLWTLTKMTAATTDTFDTFDTTATSTQNAHSSPSLNHQNRRGTGHEQGLLPALHQSGRGSLLLLLTRGLNWFIIRTDDGNNHPYRQMGWT